MWSGGGGFCVAEQTGPLKRRGGGGARGATVFFPTVSRRVGKGGRPRFPTHPPSPPTPHSPASRVHVHVPGCTLPFGSHLRLVGGAPSLGGWDPDAAPALAWAEGDDWHATLDLDDGADSSSDSDDGDSIPCKLVIVHGDGTVEWEAGSDRELTRSRGGGATSVSLAFGSTGVASYEEDPAGVALAAEAADRAVKAAEKAAAEEAKFTAAAEKAAAEAAAAAAAAAAASKPVAKEKAKPAPPPLPKGGKQIKVAGVRARIDADGSVTLSSDDDDGAGEDAATLAARLLKIDKQ